MSCEAALTCFALYYFYDAHSFRPRAGLLNGNVGVIKSSMAEMTDYTNEAQAFTYLPLSWTVGAALGPILGGYLSDPARRYPNLFGQSSFLKEYKYFLPCFVGALFPLIGIMSAYLFLKEVGLFRFELFR